MQDITIIFLISLKTLYKRNGFRLIIQYIIHIIYIYSIYGVLINFFTYIYIYLIKKGKIFIYIILCIKTDSLVYLLLGLVQHTASEFFFMDTFMFKFTSLFLWLARRKLF